jgi:hypothetical protein
MFKKLVNREYLEEESLLEEIINGIDKLRNENSKNLYTNWMKRTIKSDNRVVTYKSILFNLLIDLNHENQMETHKCLALK